MPRFTDYPCASPPDNKLGKKGTLIVFWFIGYALGALAWIVRDPVVQFAEGIGLNASVSQGLIAGLFGSTVMVIAVMSWSFLSSSDLK